MSKTKIMYGLLCGISGLLIGLFANSLSTILGGCVFTLGIILLVFSIMKLNRL